MAISDIERQRRQRERERARRIANRDAPSDALSGFDGSQFSAGDERIAARQAFRDQSQTSTPTIKLPDGGLQSTPTSTPTIKLPDEGLQSGPVQEKTISPNLEGFDGSQFSAGEERIAARKAFRQANQDQTTTTGNNLPPDFGSQEADFAITPELMQMFLDQDSIVGNEALLAQVRAMNPNLLKGGRPLTDAEWHNRIRAAMGLDSAHAGTTPFRVFDPNTGQLIGMGKAGTNQGGGSGGGGGFDFITGGGFGSGGGGFGGGGNPLTGIQDGTKGVTEQGDTFEFDMDPEVGRRLDEILGSVINPNDPLGQELKQQLTQLISTGPNIDPDLIMNRLANVREQMIPLAANARRSVMAQLAQQGLANSPAVVARALGEVESQISSNITQEWRNIVNSELERAGERFTQGLGLSQDQINQDRAFALQRGQLESAERLDLARIANEAREVFNSGRAIDADTALRKLALDLNFQQFLHSSNMDLNEFQFMVEQARIGNSFQLQQLLLQFAKQAAAGQVA